MNSQKISYLIVLASTVMAILFGLFAVTANPIIVSLGVTLIVGIVLLSHPALIVWLILILGLLVIGVLPVFFESEFLTQRLAWGVSLLGFFLLLISFFRILISPEILKNTPVFIWISLVFLIYVLFDSLMQWHSMGEFFGGFKRYFQMWGLLFALCWLDFKDQDIHYWKNFFLFVALIQLPFVLHQLIFLAPLKAAQGGLSFDVVGGTFGTGVLLGGNDAEMVVFLLIAMAFLIARQTEKVFPLRHLFLLLPLIITPFFLSETKALYVMLPLVFLLLFRHELLTRPHYILIALVFCGLLIVGLGYVHLNQTHIYMGTSRAGDITELIENTLSYNFYDRGWGIYYLNRTTVLAFWLENQGVYNPVSFFFGNGLGSSHDGTGGHMANRYLGYGIGLTALSTLLWDTGVIGSCLFFLIIISAWRCADRLKRESAIPVVRADASAIQVGLGLFTFYIFYRIGVLEIPSFQIVFVMLLGYLSLLHRRHTLAMRDRYR